MNILIPLGGKGERFQKDSYDRPKVLIPLFGKEMLQHVIDGLTLGPSDVLLIIYSDELDSWGIQDIIKRSGARFHRLKSQTEGAAQTVQFGLETLDAETLNRPTMLIDGDTIYHSDPVSRFRKCNDNAVFCFTDTGNLPIYSYLEIDKSNGKIIKIKEKEKISQLACTGAYCFRSGTELLKSCQQVISSNIRMRGEFYTSCVVSHMLESGNNFEPIELSNRDFSCVGTPLELRNFCGNLGNFKEPKRFCFDLDGTLVTDPVITGDYSSVLPIDRNIATLKFLRSIGNHITIYTARRMRTHSGNVGAVIKDIGRITMDTLDKFKIPYDELFFGKPYAHFYIDDKAVVAQSDIERATGFYTTAVQERDFNELKEERIDFIRKKGQSSKIRGEIHWYLNVPASVRHMFPTMLRYTHDTYTIEKINGTTLSRLFVAGSLTQELFKRFLDTIDSIHDSAPMPSEPLNLYANYAEKLTERYTTYDYSRFSNSDKLYKLLLDGLTQYQNDNAAIIGVIHGDPVFSNCIVNPQGFHFIDMRGILGDKVTIFGDRLYDYAKIYQSIFGYDELLLDRYVNNGYRSQLLNILIAHIESKWGSKSVKFVRIIASSLLFTLIPLHDNTKCNSYYSMAQRAIIAAE